VRYLLLRKMVNWGMSAKTFGTFRRKTKTAASHLDKWSGDELCNGVVREKHDFTVSTKSIVHGLSINLSIYLSICVSIYLSICLYIHPSIHVSPHLSTHLSIHQSIYISTSAGLDVKYEPTKNQFVNEPEGLR